MSDIGKIISDRRKELGLTLEEIGTAVGVGKSTVKKWESGFISNMKRDKIASLAQILKINPVTLITGEALPCDTPTHPEISFTDNEKKLIDNYRSLSPQGRSYIDETMEMAKQRYSTTDISKDIAEELKLSVAKKVTQK